MRRLLPPPLRVAPLALLLALAPTDAQDCIEEGAVCTDATAEPGDACEDLSGGLRDGAVRAQR